MRMLGCLLIFLSMALGGLLHKLTLVQRSRQWRKMLQFLQLVQEELRESARSSSEILRSVSLLCGDFVFLQQYQHGEGSVQQRLQKAAASLWDPRLRELALRFASRFGTACAQVQLDSLRNLEQECCKGMEESQEKSRREGNLSLQLGLLAGTAAALLFL